MTTEELRRQSLLQYADLRRKAVIDAQQDTPITITSNTAAGSSGGGGTLPPVPPGSPLTILQYVADLGPTVVWSDDNATTFTLDPTLPNYSYTLDTAYIPDGQAPTPSALEGVTIGNTVTSIGNDAFSNLFLLASVTFSPISVVTSIGNTSFADCPSLTSIEIPTSVTSIASDAFLNSGLTTVTIANGQLGITSPDTSVSFFGATVNTILP